MLTIPVALRKSVINMVKSSLVSKTRSHAHSSSGKAGISKAAAATSSSRLAPAAAGGFRRIVAAGRGRVIQSPPVRAEILRLARESAGKTAQLRVAYLGTATFDKQDAYDLQARGFADDCGCIVDRVNLTDFTEAKKNLKTIAQILEGADIIGVSGGNTLFAMTRWRRLGVDKMLRRAMDRGAVLCGGSAGAICWFDGGHSDSRDPTTTLHVRPDLTDEMKKNWKYIRVKGLGFVSGLCCPHHDTTQSNGLPRSTDFNQMLMRRSSDVGIGIDDQAALVIDGDSFTVVASSTAGASVRVTKKVVQHHDFGDAAIIETVFSAGTKAHPLSALVDL